MNKLLTPWLGRDVRFGVEGPGDRVVVPVGERGEIQRVGAERADLLHFRHEGLRPAAQRPDARCVLQERVAVGAVRSIQRISGAREL